jgi:glycosyltransferase involved in cell wall biosynthesis
VITSDRGAMKEVAGKAAVLVDPYNIETMANEIEKVLGFSDKQKKYYIKKGIKRAKLFTWKKFVDQTIEIYRKISLHE